MDGSTTPFTNIFEVQHANEISCIGTVQDAAGNSLVVVGDLYGGISMFKYPEFVLVNTILPTDGHAPGAVRCIIEGITPNEFFSSGQNGVVKVWRVSGRLPSAAATAPAASAPRFRTHTAVASWSAA